MDVRNAPPNNNLFGKHIYKHSSLAYCIHKAMYIILDTIHGLK